MILNANVCLSVCPDPVTAPNLLESRDFGLSLAIPIFSHNCVIQPLGVTFLKTSELQNLMCHPSAICKCHAISANHSDMVGDSIRLQYDFKKNGASAHTTRAPVRVPSLSAALMFRDPHVHLISPQC